MKSSTLDPGEEHHVKAKEAEASIRHLVEDLVSANDDDTAISALDLLHKLLTKYLPSMLTFCIAS